MIQENFHGRGPPPRSYNRWLLKRRIASAHDGAGEGNAAAVVVSEQGSPALLRVTLRRRPNRGNAAGAQAPVTTYVCRIPTIRCDGPRRAGAHAPGERGRAP